MGAYLAADLHLGHASIHIYRKFDSVEQHDEYVCDTWCDTVRSNKRDTAYILGDVAFSEKAWLRFDSLPGHKVVILGNHCTEKVSAGFIAGLKTVNSVHSIYRYKHGMIMSYAPMHPEHLRGKRNLHGHLHENLVRDRRYFNCSLEQINMRPIHMDEVYEEFERRQSVNYVRQKLGWKAAYRALTNG